MEAGVLAAGFAEMPVPAAVLDDRTVVVAANRGWLEAARGVLAPLAPVETPAGGYREHLAALVDAGRQDLAPLLAAFGEDDGGVSRHTGVYVTDPAAGHRAAEVTVERFQVHDRCWFLVTCRDVSRRERALAWERGWTRSRQLELVGLLAGGLVHDLNNLLTVASGFAGLIRQALAPGSSLRRDVEQVLGATDRAAQLVQQILTLGRTDSDGETVFDVGATVRRIAPLLERALGSRFRLQLQIAPTPTLVWGDPIDLERVVVNLVVNARDAMPSGGTVRIETEHDGAMRADRAAGASDPRRTPRSTAGGRVRLRVIDDGPGIDPEVIAHVFEPGFSTKAAAAGAGLGLPTCRLLVERMGGTLSVRSSTRGAVFTVDLPAYAATDAPRVGAPAADAMPDSSTDGGRRA